MNSKHLLENLNFKTRVRQFFDPILNAWWNFQCRERYWQIRNTFKQLDFNIRRSLFSLRIRFERNHASFHDSLSIIYQGLSSLILALILFFFLTVSETYLRNYFPVMHHWLVEGTNGILGIFNSILTMKPEGYSDFLGGVASVAGVFLGLYFTAVSIGVGQQLSNLSPRLRHLIVTERKGSLYIRLLTILTALSFLLWANAVVLGNISYPGIIFVTCFSLFLITAFYPIGLQSFFLADPSSIALPVFESIHDTLKKVRSRSTFSVHPSFDKYYRDRIISDIKLLKQVEILALSSQRKERDQLSNLLTNLYIQVLFYLDFKYGIESTSQWYSRTYLHDDWLVIDEFRGNLINQFGSPPEPRQEPDPDWLENEALNFTEEILKDFADRKDLDGLIFFIGNFRNFISSLANRWEIDLALLCCSLVKKYSDPLQIETTLPFLSRLMLAEVTAILQIDLVQQSLQRIVNLEPKSEIEVLTNLVFTGDFEKKSQTFSATKSLVERLAKEIILEKKIEGRIITPRWYVSQMLAKSYSDNLIQLFGKLSEIPKSIREFIKIPDDFNNAAIMVLNVQRIIEAAMRLSQQESQYIKFTKELKTFEKILDIQVPILESGKETSKLAKILDQSFDLLGELLLPTYQPNRDKGLLDFFGMAYHQLADELFRQLEANESVRFSKLYPKVLLGAFLAHQRLGEEYGHLKDNMTRTYISLDPILDMMALGGYGALFSEVHNNTEFFDSILKAWKTLFPQLKPDLDKLSWLISVYKLNKEDFRAYGRPAIRFNWGMNFLDELNRRKLISQDRFNWGYERVADPGTPFLRAFCGGGYDSRKDITEVFLSIFLPHFGASDVVMQSIDLRFFEDLQLKNKEPKK